MGGAGGVNLCIAQEAVSVEGHHALMVRDRGRSRGTARGRAGLGVGQG